MTDLPGMAPLGEPAAVDSEAAVLGIAFLSEAGARDVASNLRVEDFYLPAHQIVASAIGALVDSGDPVDPVSVWQRITASGDTRVLGHEGPIFLHSLMSAAPPAPALGYHVKQIREATQKRALARLSVTGQQMATSPTAGSAAAILDELQQSLNRIAAGFVDDDIPTLDVGLEQAYAEIERLGMTGEVVGTPTGFPDLDGKLHGLRPGQMIIVAGRPGMGKSTFMLDLVRNAVFHHNKSALVFSMEMSRMELLLRLISAQARVETSSLQTGNVSPAEWERIMTANERMTGMRLGLDDTANITMPDIRAKAQAWKNKHGLDMIAIDYLQLMTPAKRADSRQQEVSEISRGVKLLAKELGVPVLALSQLNRGSEARADKRPQVSDLRESGSLEQDADVVLMMHREELYNPDQRVGEADIIIGKHRGGPTGIIPVVAQLHYSRFVPAAFSVDTDGTAHGGL